MIINFFLLEKMKIDKSDKYYLQDIVSENVVACIVMPEGTRPIVMSTVNEMVQNVEIVGIH